MNFIIKLAIVLTIAYTGSQALNTSIDKIEDSRDKQQELINQIKGD